MLGTALQGAYGGLGNVFSDSPGLDPLADNGGSTPTMALQAGSPARDAGDEVSCTATDQRGVQRLYGPCDIGAYEATQTVCYVSASAPPGGGGNAWDDAFADLQTALTSPACKVIWVAQGEYKPTSGTDQSVSFAVLPGQSVFGGFAGTYANGSDRDPLAFPSVLSADLIGDDFGTLGNRADNSYHVVTMNGTLTPITSSTILDGFTLHHGYAHGSGSGQNYGGGLYCNGYGNGGNCSPILGNLRFESNGAEFGGAIFNNGKDGGQSSPTLHDVEFVDSRSTSHGGAMYNWGYNGSSSPRLVRVTFVGSGAEGNGGAMFNDGASGGISSPHLTNVSLFYSGADNGGAMFNNGKGGTSSPVLINVTISGNAAGNGPGNFNGAGIYNNASNAGTSEPQLVNVILWGNSAHGQGDEMFNDSTTNAIAMDYSIMEGGSAGIEGTSGSPLDAFDVGTGNLAGDPLLGTLQFNGGFTRTRLPEPSSAAIDHGDVESCPLQDQRRVARPQLDQCDIGAVEVTAIDNDRLFADGFEHGG